MKPTGNTNRNAENQRPAPATTPAHTQATGELTNTSSRATGRASRTSSKVDTADPARPPTSSESVQLANTGSPGNPLDKLHAFNDQIRDQTKSAFDTIMKVCSNARDSYEKQKKFENLATNNKDRELDTSLKIYKQGRDRPEHASHADRSFDTSYEAIKTSYRKRSDAASPLETLLPEDSSFRASLYPYNGTVRNVSTGLYADLRDNPDGRKGKDYFLCFPGTGAAGNALTQWNGNIDQAKGKHAIPPSYQEALKLATELKKVIEEKGGTLTLVGYSLGGAQANYCAMMLDLASVCFNAAPLGQGCRKRFENKLGDEALLSKQIHIRMKYDLVSSEKTHQRLLRAQQLTGDTKLFRARHYGQVYVLNRDHPKYPEIPDREFHKRHNLDELDAAYAGKKARQPEKADGTADKTTHKAVSSTLTGAELESSSRISVSEDSTEASSSSDQQTDSRVSTASSFSDISDDKES